MVPQTRPHKPGVGVSPAPFSATSPPTAAEKVRTDPDASVVPQTRPHKPRNSSRVNLLISFTFHALIIAVGFYFAARGGLLGRQLKKIAVEMVKEKPPEKPKPPPKPKIEPPKMAKPNPPPKVAPQKMAEAPKAPPAPVAPPVAAPPAVAPPAAELPAFQFSGGREVQTSADPIQLYRELLQSAFYSSWNKPNDVDDADYVDEVRVSVSADGRIGSPEWLKTSGNARWDASVRQAVAAVGRMDRRPPANFPSQVIIRFDVQEETEPVLQ